MVTTKDINEISYQTAFLETLAHVLKGNIGAGLFAMGDAFKNAGFILGVVGILFIGFVCVYNNHLLVRLSREVKRRKQLPVSPTFSETITFSFELGPQPFKKLANPVMIIMKTFICITQLGFCVIYITLVGETISTMLKGTYDIKVRWCILATFPVLLSASLIHTLKFLAPVSAVSTVFVFYGYAVSVIMCALDLPDISSRNLISPVNQWPLFIGTVIFSFEGIALIIPLKNEMKEPEKFDKPLGPLNIGMSIVMSMLLSLGFMAYFKFGDEVKDSVTFNLPQTWVQGKNPVIAFLVDNYLTMLSVGFQGVLSNVTDRFGILCNDGVFPLYPSFVTTPGESAKALFALGILFSYPLQFYVPTKIFYKDLKKKWGPFKRPLLTELVLRIGLVVVTYIIAVTIPYVSLVLSLIGAVCSNALALFFPAVADICLRCSPFLEQQEQKSSVEEQEPELRKNTFRLIMDGISLILSLIGAVFGAYIALESIVNKFIEDVQGMSKAQ